MTTDKNNFVATITEQQINKHGIVPINVNCVTWYDLNRKPVKVYTGNFSCKSNRFAKKIQNKIYARNIRMISKWIGGK